jgi:hypothetical protein
MAENARKIDVFARRPKIILRGINIAMYIAGQERRLVDPPSQWLLG